MLFALIIGYIPHIYGIKYSDPTDRIVLFCKFRGYISQSLTMMYRWLMTMACIDRSIVSSNNIYLREFSNPRRTFYLIINILILSILFPIHNLIFLDIKSGWCFTSNSIYALYHSLFTFTFGGFLPILIMLISASVIHSNLSSKYARLKQNINRKNHYQRVRDQQVLLMLLIQVIIYIISTIPWMTFLLYGSYSYKIKTKSINRIVTEKFLKYLFELIIYIYPTLSFYIYTLTSKTFRNQLFNICFYKDRSKYQIQLLKIQNNID